MSLSLWIETVLDGKDTLDDDLAITISIKTNWFTITSSNDWALEDISADEQRQMLADWVSDVMEKIVSDDICDDSTNIKINWGDVCELTQLSAAKDWFLDFINNCKKGRSYATVYV